MNPHLLPLLLGKKSLAGAVIAILRKYGTDAHVYLPGIGVINGLTAGNYLDSAGTTAATVDNPVGLVLDAAGSVLPTELWSDAGALFAGESSRVSPNVYRIYSSAGVFSDVHANVLTSGKTYEVRFTVDSITILGAGIAVDPFSISGIATTGNKVFRVLGAGAGFSIKRGAGVTDIQISNVSIKEVTGIHALQSTTANKPLLRRGAINLLLRSQEFDVSAAWAAASGITANTQIAPDGTLTADTIDSALAVPYQAVACLPSTQYTYSKYIKLGTLAAAGFKFAVRDDTAGVFIAQDIIPTQTPNASGWTRITYTFTTPVGCVLIRPYLFRNNAPQTGTFFAWGAMLNAGSLSDYVPTTTAAASSATGNYAWQFDGSNDSLALGSVPFQMADDHCVIAGGKPADTTSNKRLFSVGGATTQPIVAMIYFLNGGGLFGFWRDDAGITSNPSSTYTANTPLVVSVRKVVNEKVLRKNGVQVAVNNIAMGATTLTVANIGVGTGGGAEFYKGDSYPIIAIKGTVTDADLLTLEKFVGSLSGVTI